MQHAPQLSVVGTMQEAVWIGLVGVVPQAGSRTLNEAKGAYVTAVAFVADKNAFESVVAKALSELNLASFEFEDVEPLCERVSKWVVDDNLLELASEVESDGGVRFGTFHNFMKTE